MKKDEVSKKIKITKWKKKGTDGYIFTATIAYVDVTEEAKTILDNVSKAIWIIGKYYGEDYDMDYDEWVHTKKNARLDINQKHISMNADDCVQVRFLSGKTAKFSTSAWGRIVSIDKLAVDNS